MTSTEAEGRRRKTLPILAATALAGLLILTWLAPRLGWHTVKESRILVLYCFSTLDDVMQDRLLPAFRDRWLRERGETVEFVTAFIGSGEITSRVLKKYPAEIAIVSSELDAHRLPVPWQSWKDAKNAGIVARTPLVIVTRTGNPKGIQGFQDLAAAKVELVLGDPATSGAAELAVLAAYGSALRLRGDREVAYQHLLEIWRNVALLAPDAREARNRFGKGFGDALITYEHDVIGNPSRPRIEGEVVYPPSTIIAEPIVVKVEKNIDEKQQALADAFVEFLWSQEAQQAIVEYGFNSVQSAVRNPRSSLATIKDPFTLSEIGGARARREILDEVWRDRVLPGLNH